MLLINLDSNTTFLAQAKFTSDPGRGCRRRLSVEREEYHLTPKDGYLHSRTMLLNGEILNVTSEGKIPDLPPVKVKAWLPVIIAPHSLVFAHFPDVVIPACSESGAH